MLATGSQPVMPPIPGTDAEGVFTVSDLHKAIAIKEMIAKGKVGKAVVIGGGAIGIEMAEALTDLWGVETAIVEYKDQLLPGIIDWPLAAILEKHLRDHNVDVYLGEAAEEIVVQDGKVLGVRTGKQNPRCRYGDNGCWGKAALQTGSGCRPVGVGLRRNCCQ